MYVSHYIRNISSDNIIAFHVEAFIDLKLKACGTVNASRDFDALLSDI